MDSLHVIEYLKKSGLEIKDIRQFIEWCGESSSTYAQRREMFVGQKEIVEHEIQALKKTLNMLRFKCWYYEQAFADGSEKRLREMLPDKLPEEVQKMCDWAFE